MMATNVVRGGKRWGVEFTNLRQLQVRFSDLAAAVEGRGDRARFKTAALRIQNEFVAVSRDLRDSIRSQAQARQVPRVVQQAVFAFTDFDRAKNARAERSTLVGVRKGAPPRRDMSIYREWGRGSRRRKDNTVAVRGLGMSLSTIFEKGTKRGIRGRRYFRTAVFGARARILRRLTDAYRAGIEAFNEHGN